MVVLFPVVEGPLQKVCHDPAACLQPESHENQEKRNETRALWLHCTEKGLYYMNDISGLLKSRGDDQSIRSIERSCVGIEGKRD